MSSHPPFRLRLTLAFLILALAGVTVGAALLLGTGQADPASVSGQEIAATGPPLAAFTPQQSPTGFEGSNPTMRLGVLDKDEAIREERQARRARRDARALRALAAQQAAILDYAAAVEAADAAAAAPADTPDPTTTPSNGGGGGGTIPTPNHDGDSLYAKLDNIATCESGQNPDAYNPQGPWYGAFQFRFDTWKSYGGGGQRGQDIFNYSYAEQREIAANLARARGFAGSWPSCAARYGYT